MNFTLPTVSLNPILRRELRARWRGWRGYYPLLVTAVLLALGMTVLYAINAGGLSEGSSTTTYSGSYSGSTYYNYGAYSSRFSSPFTPANPQDYLRAETARAGREIFLYLMMGQGLLCLLIAPALTASSVASEREAGMLEALQMAPMNGWGIARGKLLAALSLGALLLLLPLPAVAVCFFMGGVSPADFLRSLALQSSIFCCGACAGLLFGSRNRGVLSAFLDAYFYVGFYSFVTSALVGAIGAMSGIGSIPLIGRAAPSFGFTDVVGGFNPVVALYSATGQDSVFRSVSCTWAWPIGLLVQFALGAICFVLAARRIALPLPDRNAEPSRVPRRRAPLPAPTATLPSPAPVAAIPATGDGQNEAAPRRAWKELPIERWLKFHNPVLQRETRARFRYQVPWDVERRSVWQTLLLFVFCGYGWGVAWLLANAEAGALYVLLTYVAVGVALVVPAIFSATTFSREREKDTWLSLHLSLLPTAHIVRGKLAASLLVCALYALPLWPPLLIAGWKTIGPSVIWVPLLVASIALFSATCGLWLSWRCRRTVTAVCGTLILGALWMFATMPLLEGAASLYVQLYDGSYDSLQSYEVINAPSVYGTYSITYYDISSYLTALHAPTALFGLANQNLERRAEFYALSPNSNAARYQHLSIEVACALSLCFTLFMSALVIVLLERKLRRARETPSKPTPYTLRRRFTFEKAAS